MISARCVRKQLASFTIDRPCHSRAVGTLVALLQTLVCRERVAVLKSSQLVRDVESDQILSNAFRRIIYSVSIVHSIRNARSFSHENVSLVTCAACFNTVNQTKCRSAFVRVSNTVRTGARASSARVQRKWITGFTGYVRHVIVTVGCRDGLVACGVRIVKTHLSRKQNGRRFAHVARCRVHVTCAK